jgi:hypothetical protein
MSDTMSQNLKDAITAIESLVGEAELISYGLAPNSSGFCYEVYERQRYSTTGQLRTKLKRLDATLEALNHRDTQSIIELYL